MTTRVVKQTLKDENDLLDSMIKSIEKFSSKRKFTKEADFIKKSWLRFLKDRRATNNKQQKLSASDLKKDFLAEISQIGAYIHVTDKRPAYSEKWKTFLECERDISGHLFNKVD